MLLVFAVVFLVQWYFFPPRQTAVKPLPPVKATAAALPPTLKLETAAAQADFRKALGEINAGVKSAESDRQKHYNDAVKALQEIVKRDDRSPDGVAAAFEIAYLQWHDMDQQQNAATTLDNITLLHIPSSETAPVFNGHVWVMEPAVAHARDLYNGVAQAINNANRSKFNFRFIAFFVHACSFIGKDYQESLALILIGSIVTILLTPVRNWQYRSMGKMSKLQPEMKKIQQEYKGQPEEINRRTMELYKQHGTNPMMGCLPMLVQAPFTYWLYYAIRSYQYQFHGKFLWIGSHFALTHLAWATPKGPVLAVSLARMDIPLLTLYAVSMYFSTKYMPMTTADPDQARQSQKMSGYMALVMPVMFYFYGWPSAFILWWLAMNVTQTLVTVFYLRHHPDLKSMFESPKAAATVAAVIKTSPVKGSHGDGKGTQGDSKGSRPTAIRPDSDAGSIRSDSSSGTDSTTRRIEPKNRRKPRGSRRF